MNDAISTELQFFLISILWGAVILLAYDMLRIFRRILKHNSYFLAIEDILFWVITSVFIFSMIYTQNNGIIRGFSIMGVTIGMVLYHYLFSDIIVGGITKLITILLTPFRKAVHMVKSFCHFVLLKGKKASTFLRRRLKKHTNSFKMKINTRRQVILVKKKKRLEQRALERQKKTELLQARHAAKLEQQRKEGRTGKPISGRKSDKRRDSLDRKSGSGQQASEPERLTSDKKYGGEPRRVVELVLDSTTGNKVRKDRGSTDKLG